MEIRIDRLKSLLRQIDLVPLKCGTVNKIRFNDIKHMISKEYYKSIVLYSLESDNAWPKTHLNPSGNVFSLLTEEPAD